ncbi:uncharacterized protein LOC117344480 [Pecten maximus]|uniref:uncharacterized protein LOC117344480 n=1 Tax=Pecten maximus TaxID=6579 RepID=UPI00145889C5|nr:uncharacterized protein LOC117344480 [Pecten maximus]
MEKKSDTRDGKEIRHSRWKRNQTLEMEKKSDTRDGKEIRHSRWKRNQTLEMEKKSDTQEVFIKSFIMHNESEIGVKTLSCDNLITFLVPAGPAQDGKHVTIQHRCIHSLGMLKAETDSNRIHMMFLSVLHLCNLSLNCFYSKNAQKFPNSIKNMF